MSRLAVFLILAAISVGAGTFSRQVSPSGMQSEGPFALSGTVAVGLLWLISSLRERPTPSGQIQLETGLEERYRDLFENSTDLVFTLEMNGCFSAMNQTAKQLLGCAQEEIRPLTLRSFVSQEDLPILRDTLAVLIGGERSALRHMRVLSRDGATYILEMNCRLRHGTGGPSGVDVIARDVTQQRQEQAALEEARRAAEAASKAKTEFLTNISHEIRTPMNGILGMTDLTLETDLTEDQRTNLQVVRASAEGMLLLINDILDFSKIEAGHTELEKAPFDILDLVKGCLDLVSLKAAQKDIELVCDIDPSLPAEWMGDSVRLRQVLVNLVGNAEKFTHAGEIVLRVARCIAVGGKDRVQFEVRDTGIGIPHEQHERIFEMFCQADGSTSRKYGGTGLGLAIASRLVALMGGKLSVDSTPGMGSTFAFAMDLETRSSCPIVEPGVLTGKKVKVMESNSSSRHTLLKLLGYAGAEVASDTDPSALFTISDRTPEETVPHVLLLPTGRPADTTDALSILRKPVSARALIEVLRSTNYLGDSAFSDDVRDLELCNRGLVSSMPHPGNSLASAKILLAEDNKINQFLTVATLQKRGYQVLVANNGIEAVAMARKTAPDLILMDIQMPQMDGLEAAAQILDSRTADRQETIPVIAMTAHAWKDDRERCLGRGMTDYIAKPLRPRELLAIVQRHLEKTTGNHNN